MGDILSCVQVCEGDTKMNTQPLGPMCLHENESSAVSTSSHVQMYVGTQPGPGARGSEKRIPNCVQVSLLCPCVHGQCNMSAQLCPGVFGEFWVLDSGFWVLGFLILVS